MPTTGTVAERVVPGYDQTLVTLVGPDNRYLARIDTGGGILSESAGYPTSGVAALAPQNRQSFVAVDGSSSHWLGMGASTIAILARERPESEAFGVIELFRVEDCGYVATLRAPAGTKALAANDRLIALVIEDSTPRISLFGIPRLTN